MSNLDVAVSSFWQLARHWKSGDKAKLELACEGGSLHWVTLTIPTSLTLLLITLFLITILLTTLLIFLLLILF